MDSTDFGSFEDNWNPARILTKYGLYRGDAFLVWFKKQITNKGFAEGITFQELQNQTKIELRVFSTDLNEQTAKEFSPRKTPTVPIAEAIRASMSIPLFFKAWKFSNNNPDNHIYVDGGTVLNYPLDTFDDTSDPTETLGLRLQNLSSPAEVNELDYDQPLKYVKYLFQTLLNSQNVDFDNEPADQRRSVKIDDFGISATDFDINDADKARLYNAGLQYTTQYLNGQNA